MRRFASRRGDSYHIGMANQPAASRAPWVIVGILAVLVVFLAGGMAVVLLMRSAPVSVTTAPTSPVKSAITAPAAVRPQRTWGASGVPRIAPRGNAATLEDGIVQREDGAVFVHAGRGAFTAFPTGNGDPYSFGFRPARGKRSPEALVSMALVNADVRARVNLTADQIRQLSDIGPLPPPSRQTQDEIITLFETYASAEGDAKTAAEKALLEAVRRDGDARGAEVEKWHVARHELLTETQRSSAIAPPSARKPTTLPALER